MNLVLKFNFRFRVLCSINAFNCLSCFCCSLSFCPDEAS